MVELRVEMVYFYNRGPRMTGGYFVRGRAGGFGMTYSRSDRNMFIVLSDRFKIKIKPLKCKQ